MKSHAVFIKPTTTLASPSISLVQAVPQTGTSKGQVIFKEFSAAPKPISAAGAIDIDDLVAELENQSTENAQAIAQGRQWVAKTFYTDQQSIAKLRLQKGWSQAELARHASTSQSYIARLELGRTDPQISTARKIATALGVSIEVLSDALGSKDKA